MKRCYKQLSFLLAAVMVIMTCFQTTSVKTKAETEKPTTVVASFDFEDEDTQGWGPRGTESAAISTDVAHTGSQSVKVTDRTKTWHGISLDMTDYLEDGCTYILKVWVYYENTYGGTQSMTLSVATTVDGKESYANLKAQNISANNWTLYEGSFTYNSTLEIAKMYMEGGTHDFYIDDASIEKEAADEIEEDIPSLKDLFAQYNCKIGTASTVNEFNESNKALIAKHFNSITVGNEMKPDSVLDYDATVAYMEETGDQTAPQITFSKAAPILKYCEANGIEIRGHVLVWHSQTPKWFFTENYSQASDAAFVSKDVMLQRMENYIKIVFETIEEEYPNLKIYTWDVVNEALENNGNGYRPAGTEANTSSSLWMQVIGQDFIEKAFEYARKYAPAGTLLAYNDYNEYMSSKRDLMYDICSDLADKGLIDVVGMQMHLSTDFPTVSSFEAAARKFASIEGIKLEITEFDMTTWDSSESGLQKQGDKYKAYFDCIKSLMAEGIDFNSITFWGTRDTTSWRASQYPCLFDDAYKAKPAFWGVVGDTVVTEAPVVTTEAPVETTEVPVETTEAPVETTEVPVETTEVPVETTEAPVVTTEAPVVTTETPVETTEVPVETTEVPVETTEAPVVTTEAPVVTTEAPVVTTETPVETTEVPVVTTETPVETTEAPVETTTTPVDGAPVVTVKTTAGSYISQIYSITPSDNKAVDVSKITLRFKYTKENTAAQSFWCDNAGIQMPVEPYYVAYTQNVKGTFGDGYLDITFDKEYTFSSGALALQVRFNNEDWSAYTNFVCGELEVYYDGVRVQ